MEIPDFADPPNPVAEEAVQCVKSRPSWMQHFRPLCDELLTVAPGKSEAITFYEQFRNGLAHLRGPQMGYALARSSDTGGKHVEVFDVETRGRYIGINVDRLYADFTAIVEKLRDDTT